MHAAPLVDPVVMDGLNRSGGSMVCTMSLLLLARDLLPYTYIRPGKCSMKGDLSDLSVFGQGACSGIEP